MALPGLCLENVFLCTPLSYTEIEVCATALFVTVPKCYCVWLIMLIRTDFPALRGGIGPLSDRYGQCYSDVEKAFIVWALRDTSCRYMAGPTTYARASREHSFDASGGAKPKPQQRRQWEGASVRQRNPSQQTLQSPKVRERLVVTAHSTARSCRSMSSYRRVFAARSEPVYFFVRIIVDFALSLPGRSLWVCLRPGPWIFSQKRQIRTRSEISSKCLTSAIDSPHVKYVKGC